MKIIRSHFCRIFAVFAFAAFMAHVLVPNGFMPVFNENGRVTIEICTSQGIELVDVNADQAPLDSQKKNHSDGNGVDCPYSPIIANHSLLSPVLGPLIYSDVISGFYREDALLQYQIYKYWRSLAPPAVV